MSATRRERTPEERNRNTVDSLIGVAAALTGIWVLAPMATRLGSLLLGGDVEMAIAPPAEGVSGSATAEALMVTAPTDAIGEEARSRLLTGTITEIVAVLALLVVVTVVSRRLRPGATLGTRGLVVTASVAMAAGLAGKLAVSIMEDAGEHGCRQMVGACAEVGGWNDPAGNTFILAGILVALLAALVRSESHFRREAEGLV